jgi:hypothetical protein
LVRQLGGAPAARVQKLLDAGSHGVKKKATRCAIYVLIAGIRGVFSTLRKRKGVEFLFYPQKNMVSEGNFKIL